MTKRTKLGLNILEAALLLGVLGDALLRETPWGLNVFLWTGALAAAMYVLHERSGSRASWRADGGWLLLPVAFFAASFAWRDSATLKLLDGLALFVSFALLAWRARGRRIRLGGLADYALGLGHAAFNALFASLPLVFSDVQWGTIPRHGVMRHAWAAARGLVIAVPLLFVFGALFMAADAVFEGIMRQTFQLDLGVLFSHIFLILLFAWMTGGFLRGMMLAEETTTTTTAATVSGTTVSEVVPVAYTSITVDGGERRGGAAATTSGATHVDDANAHRQSPGSVVDEGGATANGGSDGEVGKPFAGGVEKPGEGDAKKPGEGDVERVEASGSGGARPGAGGEMPGRAKDAQEVMLPGTSSSGAREGAAAEAAARDAVAAQGLSLGAVEVGVVLGLLNVLFACFVAVQFRYFFGGAARVMSITELTYSEYARRGFFELTWVAGLVLPLLLAAHALLRKNSPAAERIFRPLAGAQVALLFVIMASAVARMRLYQSEYGLTELRLYTTAFMLWLGLVFVWFAWTVLVRSRREQFACGALVAAFVTIGLLHVVNPDAYIVRANAAHARTGRSFDAEYAASLSADAVPALVSEFPALSRDERCLVARALSERWTPAAHDAEDWRAWNLARTRARRAVAAHPESLSRETCPPPLTSAPVNTSTNAPETPPPAPAPHHTATTMTNPANTSATMINSANTSATMINSANTSAAMTSAGTTSARMTSADANAAPPPSNAATKKAAARAAPRDNERTKRHNGTRAAGRAKAR